MINHSLTRALVILFVLSTATAAATTWTVDFENNIRQGLIEKAVKDALKKNISPADIVNALEQALLNGTVPEGKTTIVEEMVLSSTDLCDQMCGSSATAKCPTGEDLEALCERCPGCSRCGCK